MEKVKPPIQEDLNRGWMVQLNKEKVLVEFRDDLHIYIYIYLLGVVPKNKAWSDVRVVYNGNARLEGEHPLGSAQSDELSCFDDLECCC